MTTTAGATLKKPTHDVTLSDGTTTIGLMLADRYGRNSPTAIRRQSYPRQSTKISQTNNKYTDMEPPYYALMQDDWTGGRGGLTFEDDTTRFNDSFRAWTDELHQIILGGQETYATTPRTCNQSIPGDVEYQALLAATKPYMAHSFVPGANYTASGAMLWIRYTGSPETLYVEIWSDEPGYPRAIVAAGATSSLAYTAIPETIGQFRLFKFSTPPALTSGTTYWLVVRSASGTTGDAWEVGTNPAAATGTQLSTDGTTWSANDHELYYRVVDNSDLGLKFFEYKRQLYAAELDRYSVRASLNIYKNGDRGAADAGTTSQVVDATKSWTTDEWQDCIVLITKGPGSQEKQPWRVITSNNATTLTVSPVWKHTLSTSSEYVILGSNKWTAINIAQTPTILTDVAVADEIVYFACGDGYQLIRYNERNVAGTWTTSSDKENTVYADKLVAISQPGGWVLWGAVNNDAKHKTAVWRADVPKSWSTTADLYTIVTEIEPTNSVWDEQTVANVTCTMVEDDLKIAIGAIASDSMILATKAITPTDITAGRLFGMYIKSDVTTAAGDLQLVYDDTPLCEHHYLPDHVWHYDTETSPSHVVWKKSWSRPASVYFFDASEHAGTAGKGWHELTNASDKGATYFSYIIWVGTATEDYVYVSSPDRFEGVYFDLGTTVNNNVSALKGYYWTGNGWVELTIADGTANPAGTTMAQDGLVSWTAPTAWEKGCDIHDTDQQGTYLSADQYHIRFKVVDDLDGIDINEVYVHGVETNNAPESYQFTELYNSRDSNLTYNSQMYIYDHDEIYITGSKRFNTIKFDFSALNNNASDIAGYYWDGYQWVAATTGWSDGTETGGAAFAVDNSAIAYTMPANWHAGCPV